jgi:predicted ATPase
VIRRLVLTGGPGAGKTTLLAELAGLGYSTVAESAREVIAQRVARGETPRPDAEAFAREILRRDIEKYGALQAARADVVFFDRSLIEALGMLDEAAPLPEAELNAALKAYPIHCTVFVLPPWEAIYRTDAERDHTFAHAQRVHADLVRWYRRCGYSLHELPRVGVAERARQVLQVLANSDA